MKPRCHSINLVGCQTGKINITSVPSGLVANVSRAYGGKASDKYIVLKEKVIENLTAGNGVMVDKGYDIEKETSAKGRCYDIFSKSINFKTYSYIHRCEALSSTDLG